MIHMYEMKTKTIQKNGVLLGFEPRTLSTITARLIRSAIRGAFGKFLAWHRNSTMR